ncbi:uncharacterized protein LOC112686023 [Sipha flava]|uniref:Uncharacterized protein LOC112686023 n=1 Tax=Sipha flava TaxID=143950 RepID=A0A8B8FTU5_9HEMI|nr:uncharacterized protein LOC112686023 [Sipha flava]
MNYELELSYSYLINRFACICTYKIWISVIIIRISGAELLKLYSGNSHLNVYVPFIHVLIQQSLFGIPREVRILQSTNHRSGAAPEADPRDRGLLPRPCHMIT